SASPRGMRLHDRHRTDDPGTRGLTKSSSTHCSALGGRALAALPSASTAARSLHRSGSPRGSLRDQVSRFARNLPSDAIASVEVCAWLRTHLDVPDNLPLASLRIGLAARCASRSSLRFEPPDSQGQRAVADTP